MAKWQGIGLVLPAAGLIVTQRRQDAVKATVAIECASLRVVADQGIVGPDFSGDAGAILTAIPAIRKIGAVWDAPAKGVVPAAGAAGRGGLTITTVDLGENVTTSRAVSQGPVPGSNAPHATRRGGPGDVSAQQMRFR